MTELNEIEWVVRTRLRSLRNTLGLSLDDLADRANLSPSTISRIETGKRTISLDVLLPLARALQVDLDSLLDVRSDDDVVIRPVPSSSGERTTWPLSSRRSSRSCSASGSSRRSSTTCSPSMTAGSSGSTPTSRVVPC